MFSEVFITTIKFVRIQGPYKRVGHDAGDDVKTLCCKEWTASKYSCGDRHPVDTNGNLSMNYVEFPGCTLHQMQLQSSDWLSFQV